MKRGNLPQMGKDGDFTGSGAGDMPDDETPRMATAAQMAARKVKAPKSRLGGGARTSGRPAGAPFGNISGNAGQPNGGMTNGFAAQAQGATFGGFGQSQSAPNPGFGNTNGTGQGYQGSLFNIPGQNQSQSQPQSGASNNSSNFFAGSNTSTFNFGGTQPSASTSAPFSFGQPAQNNATPNGTNNQDSNQQSQSGGLFGSTPAASNSFGNPSGQTSNLFSTPAPQQTSNVFGLSNNAASAPQTEPAKPATSSLFGTPAPQQTSSASNPFGGASATPSKSLFGASTPAAEQGVSADQSMTSPENGMKTSSNLFGNATPAQSSTPLFAGFGQPKTTEAPSTAATPSAPASSSLFAGFGQPKATEASSSAATPSAPASSSLFGQSQPAADTQATASTSETPAKTGSLFGTSSQTPQAGGLFANKPKAPQNLFGAPSATATSDASTPLPWNRPDTPEPKPASEAAPTNLFAPKPSESSTTSQATPQSGSSLFAQPSSTPATKSPFTFGTTPKTTEQPASQAQGSVSIFNAPATPMSTLNSAASPAPATMTSPVKTGRNGIIENPPPPPSHFTEEQKHQWYYAFQLKSLDASAKQILRESPNIDREKFLRYVKREHEKLLAGLKRRRVDDDDDDADTRPAKRANTAQSTPASAPSSNPLFSSRLTNPNTSGSSLFSAGPTSSTPKPATPGASPSTGNLFSSSAPAANLFASSVSSNKRKSDDESGREHADGSDSGKKSRLDEDVSYPKLPESSSKTSQLFARVSNGPTDSTPVKSTLFQSTSSNTPAGSPTKATPSASSSTPMFTIQGASSSTSAPTSTAKPPSFGAAPSGTNFLSQFGDTAKKSAEAEAKKRKDDDYDSEEETEEEWAKRDKEEQEKKKAELAAAATKNGGGFVFKPSSAASTGTPVFKLGGGSEKPASAAPLFTFGGTEKSADATATPKPANGSLFGVSTTSNKPLGGSIFDKPSSSTPGGASVFDTPAKPANPFGNSFFSTPTKDNTFKGDSNTPLKFSTTTAPAINFTAASPEKAPATNGTGLFSKSQPVGGAPGASIFSKNSTLSSSLVPASVTSDTSRATSPGTTGDEGEEETANDEQIDLAGAAAGEEDEDVLFDVKSKGTVLMLDPANPDSTVKTWITKGVGQLKLLRHKTSRQCRVVLRSVPAGKVMLNTNLVPSVSYKHEKKSVRFAVATGSSLDPWALSFRNESDAAKCSELMEENKTNVS